MTADTAAPALAATARNVMDRIRYMVLGTIDEDGCTHTSPVYVVPHRYRDLYWVSTPHEPPLTQRLPASSLVPEPGWKLESRKPCPRRIPVRGRNTRRVR